jgi:3-carboxy-cis,cis-muconate cycloisomerase
MRPFSSPSDPPRLFDGVLARGGVRAEVVDAAWLAALLDVESALARAGSDAGVVPRSAADAIVAACASIEIDVAELAGEAATSGNPVVPLVARLRAAVPDDVAEHVHKGATSQDIMDTATVLIARRALGPLRADLRGGADAAAGLARTHRDTPMAGRTLLQQAVPTTFGLKAAGWSVGLDEAVARLTEVHGNRLPAQFGGAAGTLAGLDGGGLDVARRLAAALGLVERVLPWHTMRTPMAELATALGEAAGVVGKVAGDILLLAQNEVGEVSEGAPGGSSAMAHKRNPVAAVSASACAAEAPGLVASLLASMVQEHERAAGAWHAEWRPLRTLLMAVGSAASWLRTCLEGIVVHPDAMRANLETLLPALGGSLDVGSAPELVDRFLTWRAGHP